MIKIDPKNTTFILDAQHGLIKAHLDLTADSPQEHEILKQFFLRGRQVAMLPVHLGEDLRVEFTIGDPGAIARGQRVHENNVRKADGRPTVEEEEAKNRQPAPKAPASTSRSAPSSGQSTAGHGKPDPKAQRTPATASSENSTSASLKNS